MKLSKLDDKNYNLTVNYTKSIVGQTMNITFPSKMIYDVWDFELDTKTLLVYLNNHIVVTATDKTIKIVVDITMLWTVLSIVIMIFSLYCARQLAKIWAIVD